MSDLGADYSWARPGGAALAAAGVKAVGRYLASDGRGITAAEYRDLTDHGIGLWLVREGAASGMLGGYAKGVEDARIAVAQIAAVGLPSNSLVYAAADWDVQTSQFPACDDYLRGFASVLGVNRTGIYGGLRYLNHAHAAGLAVGFWQAGATSWDHGETPQMTIHFHQTTKTPPLPGTDHNYVNDMTTAAGNTPTATKRSKEIGEIMSAIHRNGVKDSGIIIRGSDVPYSMEESAFVATANGLGLSIIELEQWQYDTVVREQWTAHASAAQFSNTSVDPKDVDAIVAKIRESFPAPAPQ